MVAKFFLHNNPKKNNVLATNYTKNASKIYTFATSNDINRFV